MSDIYILNGKRTPIGSLMGGLSRVSATDLGAAVIKDLSNDLGQNSENIDKVIMGNVLSGGLGQAPARQVAIKGGLKHSVECTTVNKVCGSGMEAIILGSHDIQKENADLIVRITGDCPLVDPDIVDEVISQTIEHSADYCSNVGDRTFPRGYDVEVFTFEVLEKMYYEVTDPIEREYVTIHIRKNSNLYKIHNVSSKYNHPEWRVCVDTTEDLELIKEIFKHYKNKKQISYNNVISLFEQNPDLPKINSHVQQRTYMQK